MKGEFLSAHNRLLNLTKVTSEYSFNPVIIKTYDGFCVRILKRQKKRELYENKMYEGVNYRIFWVKSSLIDIILSRIGIQRIVIYIRLMRLLNYFNTSNLIIAHSTYPAWLANECKKKYGIPFCVTWHGSDIHTTPWESKENLKQAKEIITNADINLFVSQNLLNKSNLITKSARKLVLYNGVDQAKFYQFPISLKEICKDKFQIKNTLNVAFIGNLFPIKNVLSLPQIFEALTYTLDDVCLHIIGDGPLLKALQEVIMQKKLNVRFWGNQSPSEIPSIINIMDIILLPSLNEGLPLIALESIACGTPMVSSNVGGLSEVLGKENVFDLDDDFIRKVTERCTDIIKNNISPSPLSSRFIWTDIAKKELDIIQKVI